jgi:folate-binding protein YgfZ
MNHLTHVINGRVLTTNKPIAEELHLTEEKNYLFALPHLSTVTVSGDKASLFLQGQLTADIKKVNTESMTHSAQCNLKGRILALMDVVNWQGIQLILPLDISAQTQSSLTKAALLSKVKVQNDTNYITFGFYLQNTKDLIPNSLMLPKGLYEVTKNEYSCCYNLGKGYYHYLVHQDKVEQFSQRFIEQDQLLGSLTWHTLRLKEQQLSIYPNSRGLFLPHRLDLHQTNYLSFDKGCYKGQEIIARTHYRGLLKHELKIYKIKSKEPLFSGQKLFKLPEKIDVGEVIDFSYLDDNSYVIAVSLQKGAPLDLYLEHHSEPVRLF